MLVIYSAVKVIIKQRNMENSVIINLSAILIARVAVASHLLELLG